MHTTKQLSRILAALLPVLAFGCDVEQADGIQNLEFAGDEVVNMDVAANEPTSIPVAELGRMEVVNDNDNLYIEVSADAGYELTYLEIHADDVPVFEGEFPEGAQSYSVTVPFTQLAVRCGDQISLATFASIGTVSSSFGGQYVLRCANDIEEGPTGGCTMSVDDWQQVKSWVPAVEIPAAWWELKDVQMCGFPLGKILDANPDGDAWLTLAQQYAAAKFNLANGAASTEEIDEAMSTAAVFLSPCEIGAAIKQDALALAQTLEAYNLGETGPGACAE